MLNVLARTLGGLGCSAILTFVALTGLMLGEIDAPVRLIWQHMAGSMVMGLTYAWSSYIFEYDRWSPLRQLIVHYILTLAVFAAVNSWTRWVPLELSSLLLGLLFYTLNYTIFWLGFNWYFKRQARELNRSVNKK